MPTPSQPTGGSFVPGVGYISASSVRPTPTPATPATPPPTQTQQAWDQYLAADPFYTQTTGQISAQSQNDAAERARQIQQALIMFGEIPSGYTSPDVNDVTRAAATDATSAGLSTVARLQKAAADAQRDTRKALAARGMLRSGELGYQSGENQLAANQAQYDARQSLLDFLHGRAYNFNTAELGRNLANIQAQFEAAQRGALQGIGPLIPGYGQDVPQFRLNPDRRAGTNYYQPAGQDTTQPAPPGYQWQLGPNGGQLVPITGWTTTTPVPGGPSYQIAPGTPGSPEWMAQWGIS